MKRHTMKPWLLVPALLIAGSLGIGPAHAQGDFDGPGGLSGPAPAHPRAKSERGERRMGMRGHDGGKGEGMRGHEGMGGGHGAMMEKLNLTDRQKEQMAGIHEAQQRRMIPIRSAIAEAGLDLRKLMRDDSPSKVQIDAAIDRMAKLRADAQKARVATLMEARAILTPEQRKTMQGLHGMMGGRGMHGGMGGRGGHGGRGGKGGGMRGGPGGGMHGGGEMEGRGN